MTKLFLREEFDGFTVTTSQPESHPQGTPFLSTVVPPPCPVTGVTPNTWSKWLASENEAFVTHAQAVEVAKEAAKIMKGERIP